jgi:pyruvate,water dikinase
MAVIIQPLLSPRAAGVAYSRHPVTGQANQIMVNAVFGLAEPLASGTAVPDQYVAEMREDQSIWSLLLRDIAEKRMVKAATPSGLADQPLPEEDHRKPALENHEVLALAQLTKEVERLVGKPVDLEWALDFRGLWLLQARPITVTQQASAAPRTVVWSRANFKETLPEIPSPLGLSYLEEFMETHIVRHYRELGCRVPHGWSSVMTLRGRPYINVTLFQSFMIQLGGDPTQVIEQMGGAGQPPPDGPPRLPWWIRLRAGLRMEWKIRSAARRAPVWFAEMKQMGLEPADGSMARATPAELLTQLDRLNGRFQEGDVTLAIVAGVSQGFYLLGWLLQRRIGAGWRPLLNSALQGVGTIISAKQILWLAELAETARQEPAARDFFLADPWVPELFQTKLAGTRFLLGFEAYEAEYGHRAVGESDPMSPRFAETPGYLLGVVRGHLLAPATASSKSVENIRRDQEAARAEALQRIRTSFGWRWHERVLFDRSYRRLCRFLALREANRHNMMHFTSVARQMELLLGEQLVANGCLRSRDEIFFLTADEIRASVAEPGRDWSSLVAARQGERAKNVALDAPDTVIEGAGTCLASQGRPGETLKGIAISAGYVEGPVRLLLSPEDMKKVRKGDILVAPVIDPGMAPLLGLAAGLVVEMGGTLSHGAIIVREYGLPALANVQGVTRLLKDGEPIAVDATKGEIRRLDRPGS